MLVALFNVTDGCIAFGVRISTRHRCCIFLTPCNTAALLMMPLSNAENHYGSILFSLVIFGSALDTSVGLNFILLFVIVSGVVFSEILTSFDPAEAASVIVNYLLVGLL